MVAIGPSIGGFFLGFTIHRTNLLGNNLLPERLLRRAVGADPIMGVVVGPHTAAHGTIVASTAIANGHAAKLKECVAAAALDQLFPSIKLWIEQSAVLVAPFQTLGLELLHSVASMVAVVHAIFHSILTWV